MIDTRALTHRFGETTAIERVSLVVDDGEFVIIAGPNGAGKTTLVRHWNGLLEPDEGDVLVNDRPVGEDLVAARTAVGMVFQNPRDTFVATTVGSDVAFGPENLGLERTEIDRRVTNSLEAVNLGGRESDRISTLSGGEQQRLAIAGALAMEPNHLVLDEPLGHLDVPSRRSLLERIETLWNGGTSIVIVTHDLRDVFSMAQRVVVLDRGRIVLDDEPEAVRSDLHRYGVRPN